MIAGMTLGQAPARADGLVVEPDAAEVAPPPSWRITPMDTCGAPDVPPDL